MLASLKAAQAIEFQRRNSAIAIGIDPIELALDQGKPRGHLLTRKIAVGIPVGILKFASRLLPESFELLARPVRAFPGRPFGKRLGTREMLTLRDLR